MSDVERILIANLPPPSLVGDCAIVVGAVRLLRSGFPGATIVGAASQLSSNTRGHILQVYGVDEVVPTAASDFSRWAGTDRPDASPLQRISAIVSEAVLAGSKYAAPSLACLFGRHAARLLARRHARVAEEIAKSDLVILRGSGTICSPHLLCDLLGLRLNMLDTVMVARAMGVPYAFWGQTIWDLNGPLSKRYLWPVIADSRVTVCRENRTYEYLLSEGAPREKLTVLPDTAFAVQPVDAARLDTILRYEGLADIGAPIVGINARPLWGLRKDYSGFATAYREAFAALIEAFSERLGVHVVLVPHGYQTEMYTLPSLHDDRSYQTELLSGIAPSDRVHELRGNYTPQELVALYGHLGIVVTTRLHVAILAAVGGTPSVLISYESNKTTGIATMLGLADSVLEAADLSPARLISMTQKLLVQREQMTDEVTRRVSQLKEQLHRYPIVSTAPRPDES